MLVGGRARGGCLDGGRARGGCLDGGRARGGCLDGGRATGRCLPEVELMVVASSRGTGEYLAGDRASSGYNCCSMPGRVNTSGECLA